MVYTTNILAVPLVVAVWAVDMYLMLLLARVVLSGLSNSRAGKLHDRLRPLTDPPMMVVQGCLERHSTRPIKRWVPWAVVVTCGITVRHMLIAVLALIF